MKLIVSRADLDEGAAHLAAVCPVWARILPGLVLPLRRRTDGFDALADAIVGQQISTAAAGAIRARMLAAGLVDEGAVAGASDDDLRACGLSRPKMRYLRALAGAGVDWLALRDLPDDQVMARLVVISGIGPWTAQIYLLFALGRADAFAPADLALAEAARLAYGLDARPSPKALALMAEAWQPWRAVAARGLWAYYRQAKGREGI
ncbi:MAG: DNA-3-methyladenine glycosylase 2 family protein [Paracoccus sp. (in: a-proteobacteria)]|uniref:DNA-3-methyladenine glycosylase family protein n=1 Tax=Paracoccus sp. TaxID=267 RepID=UPI0026DF67CB|nr:DNA-3-methyladenine glycosylase 2 family protein [Paracoccus sp. (in: a-proteobacteria)]MDO5620512.1 DNA-3-methyladenine glycosylase 2 family protein [Paracoccus sp. (in: a-proteobacteria)]